jgi:hypothetical protein
MAINVKVNSKIWSKLEQTSKKTKIYTMKVVNILSFIQYNVCGQSNAETLKLFTLVQTEMGESLQCVSSFIPLCIYFIWVDLAILVTFSVDKI